MKQNENRICDITKRFTIELPAEYMPADCRGLIEPNEDPKVLEDEYLEQRSQSGRKRQLVHKKELEKKTFLPQ